MTYACVIEFHGVANKETCYITNFIKPVTRDLLLTALAAAGVVPLFTIPVDLI